MKINRLEDLSHLRKGWFNGEGEALNSSAVQWFSQLFDQNYDSSLDLPYVYPTPDGNIQLEWSIEKNEISMEVNLTEKTVEINLLNIQSKEEENKFFNLDNNNPQVWEYLNSLIRRIN